VKKRRERFRELPQSCGNIRYYGLTLGQRVTVVSDNYYGPGFVVGEPPQGTGIYVETPKGRLWLDGSQIAEATEPSR
jgi:hypothetical protein